MDERKPTLKAARDCAFWLNYCLQIGRPRKDLDFLERLRWQHHDDFGRLV